MNERERAIEARVNAATAGEWKAEHYRSSSVVIADDKYPVADTPRSFADADLIANAPADLRYLLARVRELTRERDAAREALRPVTDAVWDVRRLWNETLINFADAVGLDLDQYMELATDEQRAKWTIIHDMLFRMANPHLQAGDAAALAGNGEAG